MSCSLSETRHNQPSQKQHFHQSQLPPNLHSSHQICIFGPEPVQLAGPHYLVRLRRAPHVPVLVVTASCRGPSHSHFFRYTPAFPVPTLAPPQLWVISRPRAKRARKTALISALIPPSQSPTPKAQRVLSAAPFAQRFPQRYLPTTRAVHHRR